MSYDLKFSVITASLGNLGDRFMASGYKKDIGLKEKLGRVREIQEITGIELCYDPEGDESDADQVSNLLKKYNLVAPVVNAPLSSQKLWGGGTLSAKDSKTRMEAIKTVKKTIDFAAGVDAGIVNLWMGQDGFDYPFQVDYSKQWSLMIEGIRACADYNVDISLSLEFKPREPRNRSLLNSAATTMLLIKDVDRENVGITIDNGHVIQNGENMAQVVELCARYGKLLNIHLNDNYAAWDDDMIVGSIHLIEYLEFVYALRKTNYQGWCSVDIFPFREDAFRATEESVKYMSVYNRWIDRVGYQKLASLIENGNVTDILKEVRLTLFS